MTGIRQGGRTLEPLDTSLERPGGRRNQANSATRALDVLEYFAMVGRPLRAIDIAHAFDLHTSSTDQLLKTMVDHAYLLVEPESKRYYPSPRLVNFGVWIAGNYYGQDHLSRVLRATFAACEETVTLALRHGATMQIVDAIEPPHLAGSLTKGQRVPMVGSALGAAFLAAHACADMTRILAQIGKPLEDLPPAIVDEIEAARSRGYASGGIGVQLELWSLAIPLPRPVAGVQMVLGIAGHHEKIRLREKELIEVVRENIGRCLRH